MPLRSSPPKHIGTRGRWSRASRRCVSRRGLHDCSTGRPADVFPIVDFTEEAEIRLC